MSNFKAVKSGNLIEVKSTIPADNYKKYLDKFILEFTQRLGFESNKLLEIIQPLLKLNSWRLLNRDFRKACNIYTHQNKLMDVATFQDLWFYEGTMYLRTMYGKDAPWADGKAQEKKPTFKEKSTSPVAVTKTPAKKVDTVDAADKVRVSITHPSASDKKAVMGVYDLKNEWDRVNYGIAKRIAEDEGWPAPKAING